MRFGCAANRIPGIATQFKFVYCDRRTKLDCLASSVTAKLIRIAAKVVAVLKATPSFIVGNSARSDCARGQKLNVNVR